MQENISIRLMRFTKLRGVWLALLTLILGQSGAAQNQEKLRIVGAGTTSPLAVYSRWFQDFEKIHPNFDFIYIPSGSETGIDLATSGRADFGATDAPLSNQALAKGNVLEFATLLMAIVPIYNVPGVFHRLKFSSQALAGIYLGTITRWNDPAIAATNPEVALPASKIVVVHSAAGRGTTYIWSDYLSKISVEWRTKVGRSISVEWPVGEACEGNGNLAKTVKQTPNSIGYVELVYAARDQLPTGLVENAAGNFVGADVVSITAAATAPARQATSGFRASITNPVGDWSYPIASFTWILISANSGSPAKQDAMKQFLRWMLEDGQTQVQPAGFAPLPKVIVEEELHALQRIP